MAYTAPKCAEQIWSKSMGLASFSVCKYGKSKGSGAASIQSTTVVASGTLATNASTAATVQFGGSDLTLSTNQVFQVYASVDSRISFGGTAATATTGHFIPGGTQREYECNDEGTISMIDA